MKYVKNMPCPSCGWESRIEYNPRTDSYVCRNCSHTWPKAKPLVREKVYRCPGCGHQWTEEEILLSDRLKTAD
jgi:transposase-like protein